MDKITGSTPSLTPRSHLQLFHTRTHTHTHLLNTLLLHAQNFHTQLFHTQHFHTDFFDTPHFHMHSHTTQTTGPPPSPLFFFPISRSCLMVTKASSKFCCVATISQVLRTNPQNSKIMEGYQKWLLINSCYMFPKSWGYPKSSKIDSFSIELHCFGDTPIFGNLYLREFISGCQLFGIEHYEISPNPVQSPKQTLENKLNIKLLAPHPTQSKFTYPLNPKSH